MIEKLFEGVLLGLATGTVCIAYCGPIYTSYLLSEKRTGKESFWIMIYLNLGRFIAYAIFGGLVGLLGGYLSPGIRVPLSSAGYILFSLFLIFSVIRTKKSCSGCKTSKLLNITKRPFLLGILTGFSICPTFLIAMTRVFGSSGPLGGMMLFTGFFAGTTVYMLPFAVFGMLTNKKWVTDTANVAAVVVAVFFSATGIKNLVSWTGSDELPVIISTSENISTENLFSAMEQDTIYIITIPGYEGDSGSQLAEDLSGIISPHPVVMETDTNDISSLEIIPELSAVIAPWWVDTRSGENLNQWKEEIRQFLLMKRSRTFAVEYEPYCIDRAETIAGFLERFNFRCDPDSGFTFLMMNTLDCAPTECETCPVNF